MKESKYEIRKLEDRAEYYYEGKLHRDDGPACEWNNGTKFWFQNGQLHRLDGPAYEWNNGSKTWYQHGNLHRIDGPAYETLNGYKEWFINDEQYTEEEDNKKILELI